MARKKKRRPGPRRKRMRRHARLNSARATRWVEEYKGKNIIAGYAKWYAVDLRCALVELRLLGVKIDRSREVQIKASIAARTAERKRRKLLRAQAQAGELHRSCDEFAYIAGYAPGGAAYRVCLEEFDEAPPWCGDEDDIIEQTVSP